MQLFYFTHFTFIIVILIITLEILENHLNYVQKKVYNQKDNKKALLIHYLEKHINKAQQRISI